MHQKIIKLLQLLKYSRKKLFKSSRIDQWLKDSDQMNLVCKA